MERIASEVRRELGRLGPAGSIGEVVDAWPAAVGEQIAAHAWPARISRDGTLVVHARDSIWAFELSQRVAEIHGRLSRLPLTGLKFVPGPLPEGGAEASTGALREPPTPGPQEQARAAELAAVIEDQELRKSVQKAVGLSLAKAPADRDLW